MSLSKGEKAKISNRLRMARIRQKQNPKNTGTSNPCLWCGGNDHTRVNSAKCPRNREYKSLSKGEKAKISNRLRKARIRQNQNPKNTGTSNLCLWCGGNDHRRASSKKCQRHLEWKSLSQAEKSKKKKQRYDSKYSRRKQTERYMAKAATADVYHATKHRFFKSAAADLANRAAGHVHQGKEETINNLTIMSDASLIAIMKKWKKHCAEGSNRIVCATCGIIGLIKPEKFEISDSAIDAFKVLARMGRYYWGTFTEIRYFAK